MSYVKTYKEIFGKGLEPYGFRLIKGTKYFGRLLNKETLRSYGLEV